MDTNATMSTSTPENTSKSIRYSDIKRPKSAGHHFVFSEAAKLRVQGVERPDYTELWKKWREMIDIEQAPYIAMRDADYKRWGEERAQRYETIKIRAESEKKRFNGIRKPTTCFILFRKETKLNSQDASMRWRNMTVEEKNEWKTKSKLDLLRYTIEKKAYEAYLHNHPGDTTRWDRLDRSTQELYTRPIVSTIEHLLPKLESRNE